MFDIGFSELIIISLIALIVIGGRIALDGMLPRGRLLRRTGRGD